MQLSMTVKVWMRSCSKIGSVQRNERLSVALLLMRSDDACRASEWFEGREKNRDFRFSKRVHVRGFGCSGFF